MIERRHLERAVMAALWDSREALTAQDLVERVGDPTPAVTTVLTVLARLRRKGLVGRTRIGRRDAYAPTLAREQVAAAAMLSALDDTRDRALALSRFVDEVPADDIEALRRALSRRRTPGQR